MNETHYVMVSEWMTHGNINQFVTAHPDANRFELVRPHSYLCNSHLSDDYVLLQLGDVVKGLIYMHGQGMIHGDLKGVCFRKLGPQPSR